MQKILQKQMGLEKCSVISIVKRNACSEHIVKDLQNLTKDFKQMDYVVISGGLRNALMGGKVEETVFQCLWQTESLIDTVRQKIDSNENKFQNFETRLINLERTIQSTSNNNNQQVLPKNDQSKAFSLPSFWKEEPELWFKTVDSIFEINNIFHEKIKFGKVISIPDCSIIQENSNIFNFQDKNDAYSLLKKHLVKNYKISDEEKMFKLGDRKPSQLFNEMSKLASGQMSKSYILLAWINKLPQNIANVVRALKDQMIEEALLNMSDEMFKGENSDVFCNISKTKVQVNSNAALENKFDTLIYKMDMFLKSNQMLPAPRSRSLTPKHKSSEDNLCYYHKTFGD
ncbi:unnamed protein product [Ceutorhynchus assimilis]|uniref:DUF7041 domain-containing protein n=1 Tax=Ceutorhynchus assimilis TaxID=467358 RepID=A0A9N9QJ14_9CUCU|nr:unnamed protein product [Ceutorhynchus assimilis]